ncbi:FAD/NAD(P)-binding protein [Actinoplanes sp. NEAU-A12]|uniref:FAD/NAD(P)-binding protein n=1 Tax=Actinoplanes sandaracinus TaxID=3045177 RepID=A0ABT6WRH1_9ACTN|nr:FAD/NAD(P)-binding protein [Actinoplanes sandaracinus]MDI6102340.1 FAD/NAD(P)-binding protein [Actinoplanes sandaracinus]
MTSTLTREPATAARTGPHLGTVAIVGGGCSGVLAARAITRDSAWRTVLISPESRPGRGVAYGAAEPWHLLNSRAAAMSADSGDPQHLLRWCRDRGRPAEPGDFLPRAWFGDYLADQFAAAAGPRLAHHRATAVGVRADGPRHIVTDDAGGEVRADHVILALGNPPPCVPSAVSDAARRDHAFIADPWAPGALEAVPADEPVLLLGTGLTAVDVALTLTRGARRVPVEALSRRGLPPLAHPRRPAPAVDLGLPASASLGPLVRRVREAVEAGADWTAVVDHVRTQADRLWSALDADAQARFLRHCQRHWEVHRHRMAPPVAARVADLREQGLLRLRAGRLTSIEPHPGGGLVVTVDGERPRRYAAVVTCTGPGPLPCSAGPLLSDLLADGLVRTGPHRLGIDTDTNGQARPGLWLVGPLRRGRLWEATAVPEIRAQADRLAAALPQPAGRHPRRAARLA